DSPRVMPSSRSDRRPFRSRPTDISHYDIHVRPAPTASANAPTDADYQALLEFRDELRRFLHWSEQQAVAAGITPAQYQLLLAIRGHAGGKPTIGDVAEHLLLRHHSVVGLVDRAESAGLVSRRVDPDDQRLVRLSLTARGTRLIRGLANRHLHE